jgi:hypothetical protein
MAVTKKPPLAPINASRSEMDAYAQKIGGLQSTGPNQGAATRNRVTPPTTQAPQPPTPPGAAAVSPSASRAETAGPVLVANLLDIGQCTPGDQVSFQVLSVQNGQVSLGNPLVLPGTVAAGPTTE